MSIADRTLYTAKSSARPAGQTIIGVLLHHWAGTGSSGINRLVHSSDPASANYIIADGQIIASVPENRRAWTSGSATADNPRITIEVQNSAGAPNWPVSAANLAALIRLIAYLADKYVWGTLGPAHVRGHLEFQATACPGPYLWSRRAQIISAAQAARTPEPAQTPAPTPAPTRTPLERVMSWYSNKDEFEKAIEAAAYRGVLGHTMNAFNPKEPYGMPKETVIRRIRRIADRAGRALIVARDNRTRLARIETTLRTLGGK